MLDVPSVVAHFARTLETARLVTDPYRHWLLTDALPPVVGEAIASLAVAAPTIGDTEGRRETHNSTRVFFAGGNLEKFAVGRVMADTFQNAATVDHLERTCEVNLGGGFLRIEYCQDVGTFWLEPHTDIGAKLFTMQIYLTRGTGAETLGTSIYRDGAGHLAATAPSAFGQGLIFIPGSDTWHGFDRRAIPAVRKSVIVNYVKPEWRSRHELAFPDRPVG